MASTLGKTTSGEWRISMNCDGVTSSLPLKICLVPQIPFSLLYGGAEVQAEQTKAALERRGHDVRWIDMSDRLELEHVDVLHFFGAGAQFSWWTHTAKNRVPIICSSIFYENSARKRFYWKHACNLNGTKAYLVKRMLLDCDRILPNSLAERTQVSRLFGISATSMAIIPNGVESSMAHGDGERFHTAHPEIPRGQRVVLFVGRIEPNKNVLGLLKAFSHIENVVLIIVGQFAPGVDRRYQAQVLSSLSEQRGSVFWLGAVPHDQLADFYAAAAVHVLPSFMETPGLSALEAGLAGCNLVVGNSAPSREYFDGIAEITKPEPTFILKSIRKALGLPRNFYHQSEHIAADYTWDTVAEQTEHEYFRAIEAYKARTARLRT